MRVISQAVHISLATGRHRLLKKKSEDEQNTWGDSLLC